MSARGRDGGPASDSQRPSGRRFAILPSRITLSTRHRRPKSPRHAAAGKMSACHDRMGSQAAICDCERGPPSLSQPTQLCPQRRARSPPASPERQRPGSRTRESAARATKVQGDVTDFLKPEHFDDSMPTRVLEHSPERSRSHLDAVTVLRLTSVSPRLV